MNLCGDMNSASLRAAGSPSWGFISMSTYGAAAATSQSATAPCWCSSLVIRCVSVTIPVTLLAALNEPILSERSAYRSSSPRSWSTSMWPSTSSWIVTTSAIDSRQGSSLLWCS